MDLPWQLGLGVDWASIQKVVLNQMQYLMLQPRKGSSTAPKTKDPRKDLCSISFMYCLRRAVLSLEEN